MNTPYETLAEFLRYPTGDAEMEELYTRTFDIQAPVTLDVGYILFGEDYKRGHLLVKLQSLHQQYGNDCGTELADHLPNVLTLLPRLSREEASRLVSVLVLPAIQKMIAGLAEGSNPYRTVLEAVSETLTCDFTPEAMS